MDLTGNVTPLLFPGRLDMRGKVPEFLPGTPEFLLRLPAFSDVPSNSFSPHEFSVFIEFNKYIKACRKRRAILPYELPLKAVHSFMIFKDRKFLLIYLPGFFRKKTSDRPADNVFFPVS